MLWEVEQKHVQNVPGLRAQLTAAGAVWEPQISQADHYFNHPARDFAATDEALRLRQVGSQNFITYKGPRIDSSTKTRQELELPLPDGQEVPQQFGQLLVALGFRPVAVVRKCRLPGAILWEGETIHLALDEVSAVGSFVELELVVEEAALEPAKMKLQSLANHLNLAAPERRSYLELLLAKAV